MEAAGITNFVFDAASIAVVQRARRAKTDRIDGELLLRTLMAYLRGEPRVVRIVGVPSVEAEDARRTSRERDRLITEQRRCCAGHPRQASSPQACGRWVRIKRSDRI
ncbi:hypothetical protein A1D31_37150 [Bradyrhizobium liaoningense]|nr:hypothetical protein A1D31_37150 [Bradyrhizobium liaoningense]